MAQKVIKKLREQRDLIDAYLHVSRRRGGYWKAIPEGKKRQRELLKDAQAYLAGGCGIAG